LPVGKGSNEVKQTNEIKYAPLLLDQIALKNKDITSGTLHTQVAFANYLAEERKAHYYCCVKKNQANLLADLECYFSSELWQADYTDRVSIERGHIE